MNAIDALSLRTEDGCAKYIILVLFRSENGFHIAQQGFLTQQDLPESLVVGT
jgi:hypothetical protein